MKYDFESLVDRRNLGSAKWMDMINKNPLVSADVVPLSVADMEFKHPRKLIEALKTYLDTSILGYTMADDNFYEAVIAWLKRRHNFKVEKEWIVNTSGVVPAFFNAIRNLSDENNGVIVFSPVYYPFYKAINNQKRRLVDCPLINNKGHYEIDFDLFDKQACKKENKILLFCSPHNPVGRVWSKKELEALADIIIKNDLILLSDEIHSDLIMKGFKHTVFQTISEELSQRTITMTAPSKSFNLAGMGLSNIIIKNEKLREKFKEGLMNTGQVPLTALSYKACEIAYNQCEDWLDECISVIDKNQRLVHDFFKNFYPQIKACLIEGTYLQWIDFRGLNIDYKELEKFMVCEAELFLDEGYIFGDNGKGFERMNLAVPSKVIENSLKRLDRALKARGY